MRKTVALIIVIIIILALSLFALYLANLESHHLNISPLYHHKILSEFVNDMGVERAKQLLHDGVSSTPPYAWRPWPACKSCGPNSFCCNPVCDRCQCPNPTLCDEPGECSEANCGNCYLEEHITIPQGGKKGTYRIYVTGPKNSPTITVESQVEEAQSITTSP